MHFHIITSHIIINLDTRRRSGGFLTLIVWLELFGIVATYARGNGFRMRLILWLIVNRTTWRIGYLRFVNQ